MGCTVKELLERIDSRELSEWLAFDNLEPFDNPYWRTGQLCSVMATIWGDGKQKYCPAEFMPGEHHESSTLTTEKNRNVLSQMAKKKH